MTDSSNSNKHQESTFEPEVNKPNGTGLIRIINATRCSFDGIKYAYTKESAFRQELTLCGLLFPFAIWLASSAIEFILLVGPLLLLLVVECINSAIEAAIDRISTQIHPLSKQAKDLGSGAVFLSMLIILVSWTAIIVSKIF